MFAQKRSERFARWAIMASETPANGLYHLLDRFDLDDDLGRLYNFMSRHQIERRPAQFWIIPKAREMLEVLHRRYPLAVVSARGSSTYRFLDQFELLSYFQTVVTAETCRYTKPYPDPILWAAEKMNVDAADCLMVGDTTVDIKAGRAAGAQTVGVLCGFGVEKELRRAGADLILSNTAELADLFRAE
jgi:HAD superfamily hydrolase (TIGR01509 family)